MHPHPDQKHVMVIYRRHVLFAKRSFGSARSLVHYRGYVYDYLDAKRVVLKARATTMQENFDVVTQGTSS